MDHLHRIVCIVLFILSIWASGSIVSADEGPSESPTLSYGNGGYTSDVYYVSFPLEEFLLGNNLESIFQAYRRLFPD